MIETRRETVYAASACGLEPQCDRLILDATGDGLLLGVVNGYGGHEVADICADWAGELWRQACPQYWRKAHRDIEATATMREVCNDLAVLTADFQTQAATLSLVFVPDFDSDHAYVAILGDSPVIVKHGDGSIEVNPGHNLSVNRAELTAAVARGGYDMNDGYIRVEPKGPGLPTGRALGMGMLGPVISKQPDIFETGIGDFLLLATLGVFGTRNRDFLARATNTVHRLESGATAAGLVQDGEENATAIVIRRQ